MRFRNADDTRRQPFLLIFQSFQRRAEKLLMLKKQNKKKQLSYYITYSYYLVIMTVTAEISYT